MSTIEHVIEELPSMRHLNPATNAEIKKAEKALGLRFADEYKNYTEKYGAISANGFELTGVTSVSRLSVVQVTCQERNFNKNIPDEMYVVENIAIDGIVILQNQQGEIFEIRPNSNAIKIANCLSEYLNDGTAK